MIVNQGPRPVRVNQGLGGKKPEKSIAQHLREGRRLNRNVVDKREVFLKRSDSFERWLVTAFFERNPEAIARVRERPGQIGWIVGHMMRMCKGQANPQVLTKIATEKLEAEWESSPSGTDGPGEPSSEG